MLSWEMSFLNFLSNSISHTLFCYLFFNNMYINIIYIINQMQYQKVRRVTFNFNNYTCLYKMYFDKTDKKPNNVPVTLQTMIL